MIGAVAAQQLKVMGRQRVVTVLVAAIMAMTAAAGVIGWSSHNTIEEVYRRAVGPLHASGRSAPPDPFAAKPPLSLLANMAIYLSLVGGLLALVLGHVSFADERFGGVGRLVFSRPASRWSHVHGRLLAVATILAGALTASLALSAVSVAVVNGALPAAQLLRLAGFFGLAWMYLTLFAMVGMAATLVAGRRSSGLLWGLGVWLVLTFVVPQFTSGLRPVASLNPVTAPVSTSPAFFRATSHLRAGSLNEQYKQASSVVLQTSPGEPAARTAWRVLPVVLTAGLLWLAIGWLVAGRDFSQVRTDA